MKLPLLSIQVGERRREDLGDIEGLAASIAQFGLLHPVVIDSGHRLVAGERRLMACESLGWTEIDVRELGALTDTELREIELDENLRRKDLTQHERNKVIAARVELAREIIQAEEETCATVAKVSPPDETELRATVARNSRGHPSRPGSLRDVAQRIGVPEPTIRRAQEHVAAVEKYPELGAADIPQSEAIAVAKRLDTLPPEKQSNVRQLYRESENADVERRKAAREQAKSEQDTSNHLAAAIVDPSVLARAAVRNQFRTGMVETRKMIGLRVSAVAEILPTHDRGPVNSFIRDCRGWLDDLEAELSRGLHVVGGPS